MYEASSDGSEEGQSPDDRPIYDLYIGSRASAALAVGVRLGLFEMLATDPAGCDEVAQRLAISRRGADALLVALHGMGVLTRDEGRYAATASAAEHLVPGGGGSLCDLIEMEFDSFLSPERLLDSVRSGSGRVYGDQDPWQTHREDPDRAERFTRAMHSISTRPARALARTVDFGVRSCLLEIGAGSGIYPISVIQAHPHMRAVLLDLPEVCDQAASFIAAAGLTEQARMAPGDMFTGSFPGEPDVILFSQILHDWSPKTGAELLASAYEALPTGGLVIVHEKLLNDDRGGPQANALVSLDMLFWTEGQQLSGGEVTAMLLAAGFRSPRVVPTEGYWSVVLAEK